MESTGPHERAPILAGVNLRRALPFIAVLLAAVAAALLLAPRLINPAEDSREVRFVREMIQHHTQAIDMATRVRDTTTDPELRSLALDIMLGQQEQIGQMRGWLTLWGRPWAGDGMSAEHARMMGMATQAEVATISTQPEKQAEVTFLQLMTRHHQGALAMVPRTGKRRAARGTGPRPADPGRAERRDHPDDPPAEGPGRAAAARARRDGWHGYGRPPALTPDSQKRGTASGASPLPCCRYSSSSTLRSPISRSRKCRYPCRPPARVQVLTLLRRRPTARRSSSGPG